MTIAIPLSDNEKYELLLQKLMEIRSERSSNAHRELVLAKYEAGQAVATSGLYNGKHHAGSGALLLHVARDMGWSKAEMYNCVKFWETVEAEGGQPALSAYIDSFGVGASWTKLKKKLNEGQPRIVASKKDKPWRSTKAIRTKAVSFAAKKIGDVWTEADQDELEKLLNVETKKGTSEPQP